MIYLINYTCPEKYRGTYAVEAEDRLEAEEICQKYLQRTRGAATVQSSEIYQAISDKIVILNGAELEYDMVDFPVDDYIDENGNPYVEGESWPAGGGFCKDCDFNAEALYAFKVIKERDAITKYLTKHGGVPGVQSDAFEEWFIGNTRIIFESYVSDMWGYVHTELLDEPLALA